VPTTFLRTKRGPSLIDKTVGIAGEQLTGRQIAEQLSRALGQPIAHYAIEPEAYRKLPFPGADDLGNMFQYKRDFETEFCKQRDVEFSRSLNPELQSFATWVERNKGRIPLPA
jgi:lactate dehydrogenase-like 2-hydroxyacid dehydrogenase